MEIIDDYVCRTHLSVLEQDLNDYASVLQVSRMTLSNVPADLQDSALDSLYRTFIETGILEAPNNEPVVAAAEIAAPLSAEPVWKPAVRKPSTVRKERDAFLAESLGIPTSRLKYNQATLERIPATVLEHWHFLDELYCASVYNTTQFAKDKNGRYAVFVDGHLHNIYDTRERASRFTHNKIFPFGTYIVCIGDEWNVKEPIVSTTAIDTERSRQWNQLRVRLGKQIKDVKAIVHKKTHDIATWLLDNPLIVLSVIVGIMVYALIVNQTPESGQVFVHYAMFEIDEHIEPIVLPTATATAAACRRNTCCSGGQERR